MNTLLSFAKRKQLHSDKIVTALNQHLRTELNSQEFTMMVDIFPEHMQDLLPTEYDHRFLYLVRKMRRGIRS